MTLFSGLQLSDLRLDDLDDRQVYRLTARCQVYGTSKNISLCLESDMNYQSHVRQSLHSTQYPPFLRGWVVIASKSAKKATKSAKKATKSAKKAPKAPKSDKKRQKSAKKRQKATKSAEKMSKRKCHQSHRNRASQYECNTINNYCTHSTCW